MLKSSSQRIKGGRTREDGLRHREALLPDRGCSTGVNALAMTAFQEVRRELRVDLNHHA
jgi:hypothetical protein